jgi:hypothetical protein
VSGRILERIQIEGITESWLKLDGGDVTAAFVYRPALLVECTVNFRSLRAGLNHSEERNYSAWLPEADLAIDWDLPAVNLSGALRVAQQADSTLGYRAGNYEINTSEVARYVAELIDKLVRTERLSVYFNPVFGLFSAPGDPLEDFLDRVADAALGRVEPELRRLRNRFELQLEQVREAQAARGTATETLNLETFVSNRLHFLKSETRLAGMFSTLAGAVFGSDKPLPQEEKFRADEAELREDLGRLEQEASDSLRVLYEEYRALASEYDTFEIGLQPDNIQVIRNVLLWVPVNE